MEVVIVYFAYLTVAALMSRVRWARRWVALAASLAALALVFLAGMRHIMPLIYLLLGYWIPGILVQSPDMRLESRLLEADYMLFGPDGLKEFVRRAPRVVLEYLESAYLCCYLVVPAGFVFLVAGGFQDRADRFWPAVLLASFVCYGLLPWLPSRAPRALERDAVSMQSSVRRLNIAILQSASVQWNTFPSGHTAASVATALAVGHYDPAAGAVFGVIAISIAVGSVVGRYHYAADALAGAAVAVGAFVTANVVRGL